MLCQYVFQPVIRLIQIVVSIIEFVLVQVCQLIKQLVNVLTNVLQYICSNVVQTVCGAVCGVVCGICDFFCGIFGCDCGCENVCNNVCNTVTNVVCAWTWVLTWVLQAITTLVCDYIVQAFITLLNLVEAIVTMVLTWICTLIDVGVRWFLCWTYIAEIFDNTNPRWFKVAPKIVRNREGYSDWFIYVNNKNRDGTVDQNAQGYILSDTGRPLLPVVDAESGDVTYYEVATREGFITGQLRRARGDEGRFVAGQPCLYYPYKVIEIAGHLFADIFASAAGDTGIGTDFTKNLFTYNANVQAWLNTDGLLANNNYNAWSGKYDNKSDPNYFGDNSIPDKGTRVDTDKTCDHPTNASLSLVNGGIQFTPTNTGVAEEMSCGAGQIGSFDQNNFLLLNKDADASAVTTYFVSKYNRNDTTHVGCNYVLGFTVVTFDGNEQPQFIDKKVLPFAEDTNEMMRTVVENLCKDQTAGIVRCAETYLHECGHQCGLLHESDKPDCENDTTLHISKVMDPDANVRRAHTRFEWCMIRTSVYMTSSSLSAFEQAPELPDSGRLPTP